MNKSDEQNEILAALALGSLDENEARLLSAQIESDPKMTVALEEWQDISANIAFIAPPVEPAPELRDHILAVIRKTPQLSISSQEVVSGAEIIEKGKAFEQEKSSSSEQLPKKADVLSFPVRSKHSLWSFVPTFGAVAASIVAVLLGVSLYNASQSNKAKDDQIAELNQKIIDTRARLERERQERELLSSPATFVKALDGTKELPTAKARLVFDPKTGQALLYVEGLPAAPRGKAYQIWFISDPKHPAPGKTFGTDNSGKGVLREQIPAQYTKASVFAVTLEPESGSPAPTSSPLLLSAVS